MKKFIVLTVLALFLATPAMAATITLITPSTGNPTTASIGGGTFACSTLVTLMYASDSVAYTADSGHLNGDKQFATTSVDSSIDFTAKAKGTAVTALTTALADVVPAGS